MNLIPIPSESCPHCRRPGTQCDLLIVEVPKTREREKDFLRELGKKYPDNKVRINEAYLTQTYVCRNK